jgi:hypothetical protein
MIIRREQSAGMLDVMRTVLAHNAVEYLRASHSDVLADIDEQVLNRRALDAVLTACQLGFELHSAIIGFVVLTFIVGPCFHQQPDIRCLLEDRSLPEQLRLKFAVRHASAASWKLAATLRAR